MTDLQTSFYTLVLLSGTYEMIILMLAFREFLTWRISLTWTGLIVLQLISSQVATLLFPHVPLIFLWIVPATVINTVMSTRLLNTKWILMLPIIVFLTTLTRLISDGHFGLPLVILLGLAAHRFVVRSAATDFFQQAKIDHGDYLLVLLCYGLYVAVYAYGRDLSLASKVSVSVAVSVVFGTVSFYLINNQNRRLTDAQRLNQVSQYNQLLRHRNQQLHLFKHDYQNVLLSLSQYIQADDMPGLKRYFEREVWPNDHPITDQTTPDQLRYLNAPALSGLIYSKYEAAASRQVDLQVTILRPVDLPQTDQVNLVRIIGNLLDNAIDGAVQADHQVQFVIDLTPDSVVFTVQNQIAPHDTVDLTQISKRRFTTKPGHLGYGLSSIAQLTNQAIHVAYHVDHGTFLASVTLKRV